MTDNVLDARLPFALGRFKTLHLEHIKKYKDIPLCKTVTSFLEHHNASTFTALDGVERKELTSRMQYMFTTLEQTSKELLLVYGVEDESDLSGMQRKAYDAAGTNHIYVCTDPVATNYDKTATSNDGRCLYAPASITRFATWINTAVGTTTLLTETGSSTTTATSPSRRNTQDHGLRGV